MKPVYVVVLLFSSLGVAPRLSSADALRESLAKGIVAFETGSFADAIRRLRIVVGKGGDPKRRARAYLYLGLAHASAGNPDGTAARFNLRRALELDATLKVDVSAFPPSLVDLFETVRKGVQGTLKIECDRDNAEIDVDGGPRGRCGVTLRLPVGVHKVRARAGIITKETDLVVRVAGIATARLTFGPLPPVSALRATTTARPAPVSLTIKIESPRNKTRHILGITLLAAGGAALAAGGVLGALRNDPLDEFNAKIATGALTAADADALAKNVEASAASRATAATALLISGGVTAAAGIVLLLIGSSEKPVRIGGGRGTRQLLSGRWEF